MKHILLGSLLLCLLNSCVSHQELVNFNEADFPQTAPEDIINAMNLVIQPEDLLRITVHSFSLEAAAPFNLEPQGQQQRQLGGNQGTQQLELFMGYFVDQNGMIDFPVLGQIFVAGKTLEEAKQEILDSLQPYLKDPVVNIRYLNFKITVLGEVNAPGTVRLTNKRVTLLEAIGMAGDLTSYANRSNVLVIREENGSRSYQRLNLRKEDVFASPYFYLQQNDVVYIEPIRARVATVADPAFRIVQYATAALSLTSLIIAITR